MNKMIKMAQILLFNNNCHNFNIRLNYESDFVLNNKICIYFSQFHLPLEIREYLKCVFKVCIQSMYLKYVFKVCI